MRRPIREDERRLLLHLAGFDPEFRQTYEQQAREIVEVDDVEDDGTFIRLSSDGPYGVRVEACAEDEGGEPIEIILFGNERNMSVLELVLFREGGVKRFPSPGNLKDVWDHTGHPRPKGW